MSRAAPRVNVIDLEKYLNAKIRVKFAGGREFVGTLKGFDQLVNIVLDDAVEFMRGASETASAPAPAPPLRTQRDAAQRGALRRGAARFGVDVAQRAETAGYAGIASRLCTRGGASRLTPRWRPPPFSAADPADPLTVTETTRYVGLVVARGTAVTIIGPEEGMREIANPFEGEEEE